MSVRLSERLPGSVALLCASAASVSTSITHASTHAFGGCVGGEADLKSKLLHLHAKQRGRTGAVATMESGFGELLRHYRLAVGLTQEELAERAGVSTRGISDLERGARGLPRKDTLQLLLQGLDLAPADRAALVAAARRSPAPAGGRGRVDALPALPVSPTPLIGRERELATARDLLLRPDVRLLTLTGPGGTGKTRLALQFATDVRNEFPDGVAFVALAPIRDPELVAATIAQALGVQEAAGRSPLAGLQERLHDKECLLLLDNFEQVVAAAPVAAELLAACPALKVLVTSRGPLHLRGERVFAVPPLALPDAQQLPELSALTRVPAVQLFLARAQDVKADFTISHENAPAITEICHRLDGLPLALELAAARVKILSPAALLARLDRRLPLLTSGAQDLPQRQQTLRNTIAWSYDLLRPEEQALFQRLAVFVGGFTLEAAEAVIRVDEELGVTVLESVASLVDASLLRGPEESAAEPRFNMLATVSEFALEQLDAGVEGEATRRAHAAWCLSLVEPIARRQISVFSREELRWLHRVEAEHDNLRAALAWAQKHQAVETRAQLVAGLARFWRVRGYLREGRDWVKSVLSAGDTVDPKNRVRVLHGAGLIAVGLGDYSWAVASTVEGVELARQIDDRAGVALNLHVQGVSALDQEQYAHAVGLLEQAVAGLQEVGDDGWRAVALGHLGLAVAEQGDVDRALRLWDMALAHDDNLFASAYALQCSADVLNRRGDYHGAAERYHRSLALWQELGDTWYVASCLTGVATMAVERGWSEKATHLLSAADALREASGAALRPRERTAYERAVATARAHLDDDVFTTAWTAGRSMTLQDIVAAALEVERQPQLGRLARPDVHVGLTARELQVLRLVAEGSSDREIAAALFLSRRTVTSHLTSILNKLSVASRSAAVAYAVRHDLV
jgi:predicted ATPase/DNA-binding CsgD family transcriptional regulator/DNA-binding XRE family transcriptional regulator